MKIILAGRGMPHCYETLEKIGLGGSETAQAGVALELARLGHTVLNYVDLKGAPPGYREGVYWDHVDMLQIKPQECDVLIVCRNPSIIHTKSVAAGCRVLWVQDFACDYYPNDNVGSTDFDRIMYVSRWQRDQWKIWATERLNIALADPYMTRNGILRHNLLMHDRDEPPLAESRRLLFASRPERGLEVLVRPGGVLDRLSEAYTLEVCGYDDYPKEYAPFYERVWGMCRNHPRVTLRGSLPNARVRVMLGASAGLVLPTNYPETSCMIAREAIEQLCPVFTTSMDPQIVNNRGGGALEETVGSCGWLFRTDEPYGTDHWAEGFARMVQQGVENAEVNLNRRINMLKRKDLHWDDVARDWTILFYNLLEQG